MILGAVCVIQPIRWAKGARCFGCVPGEIRTPDTWFRRPVLYPLSYRHIRMFQDICRGGKSQGENAPSQILRIYGGLFIINGNSCAGILICVEGLLCYSTDYGARSLFCR